MKSAECQPWLHEGLAVACCRRFFGRGIPAEELIQEARAAICMAQERFDPNRGCQFSTYAVPVVLGALKAYSRRWFQAQYEQKAICAVASLPFSEGDEPLPAQAYLPLGIDSPPAATQSFEERILLRDAIRRLGDPLGQVIGLRYLCGLTQRETGQRLGKPQWQVCRWEAEGLRQLKDQILLL